MIFSIHPEGFEQYGDNRFSSKETFSNTSASADIKWVGYTVAVCPLTEILSQGNLPLVRFDVCYCGQTSGDICDRPPPPLFPCSLLVAFFTSIYVNKVLC